MLVIVLFVVALIIILYFGQCRKCNTQSVMTEGEKQVLDSFHNLDLSQVKSVSKDYLNALTDRIYIAVAPSEMRKTKEGMSLLTSDDYTSGLLWLNPSLGQIAPLTSPSKMEQAAMLNKFFAEWPPGLYNRMTYVYPGFSTGTGYSFYKRQGVVVQPSPRNRWVRHTATNRNITNYYYIVN